MQTTHGRILLIIELEHSRHKSVPVYFAYKGNSSSSVENFGKDETRHRCVQSLKISKVLSLYRSAGIPVGFGTPVSAESNPAAHLAIRYKGVLHSHKRSAESPPGDLQ